MKKLLIILALTVVCLAAQALALYFFNHLTIVIRILFVLSVTCLYSAAVLFAFLGKKELFRLALTCLIALVVILSAYIVLDLSGFFETFTSFDSFKNFILSTGRWAMLVYTVITILQVVLIPIPSMVSEVVATNLFGPLTAFLLSVVGIIIGSQIAYLIGRFVGKKLVVWIAGKEKTEKYIRQINQNGSHYFVIMMVVPFFPDDILCMAAGLSRMPYWYFLLVITLTRPISSAVNCFFGSGNIIPFSGWGIPVWILIFIAIGSAFVLYSKNMNKKNRLSLFDKRFKAGQVGEKTVAATSKLITNPQILHDKEVFEKIKSNSDYGKNVKR